MSKNEVKTTQDKIVIALVGLDAWKQLKDTYTAIMKAKDRHLCSYPVPGTPYFFTWFYYLSLHTQYPNPELDENVILGHAPEYAELSWQEAVILLAHKSGLGLSSRCLHRNHNRPGLATLAPHRYGSV